METRKSPRKIGAPSKVTARTKSPREDRLGSPSSIAKAKRLANPASVAKAKRLSRVATNVKRAGPRATPKRPKSA